MNVIGLDDGRVIVYILLDDGPASQAGMEWGAEILAWDGWPIMEALLNTETVWAEKPQATSEDRRLEQYRFLVRDPVGMETSVTFQNPGAETSLTVTLVAQDDQMEGLNLTLPPAREDIRAIFKAPIQAEVLPGGYGYVSIRGFMPTLGGIRPEKIMDRAIASFIEQDVPGIIIDVRGSNGGLDRLVPQMVGHFYVEPEIYEYVAYYDVKDGQFRIDPEQTLMIEPRAPYYGGPVIVLVDTLTVSTAEGLPMSIQRLPQGQVLGFYGTHGSFAVGDMVSDLYRMPGDIAFNFYAGCSLDADKNIQVDANAKGVGGVIPDVRVPLTEETVYAQFIKGKDVVLEAAITILGDQE